MTEIKKPVKRRTTSYIAAHEKRVALSLPSFLVPSWNFANMGAVSDEIGSDLAAPNSPRKARLGDVQRQRSFYSITSHVSLKGQETYERVPTLRRALAQRRIGKFIANARTEVNRNKNETHYRVPTRPGIWVKRPGRRSKKNCNG
jgi:hypothetical protein